MTKVLILAEDNYEELELWYPRIRLVEAGAGVTLAGISKKTYLGKHGYPVEVDGHIGEYREENFDAVLDFVRGMHSSNKIVASICHGAWVPVSAGIVRGKKMTCADAIRDDIKNAGAIYLDQSVVVDGSLITSRRPSDLPDFCREILKTLEL